jgi:hypothetical protein
MKKIYSSLLILSLLFVGQAIVLADTGMQDGNYKHTFTLGNSTFHVSQDEREVHYTLNGDSNTLMCHEGYTVATLSGSSGMLNQSHLTQDAFKCSPNIQTVPHLVQALREGKIHLGTHTGHMDNTHGSTTDMYRTYKVMIENLTTTQPLSPGVLVAHDDSAYLWKDGMKASEGIRLIAEEGKPDVAYNEAMSMAGVHGVSKIDMPIQRKGTTSPYMRTFEIVASDKATKLSAATMLVCTNDGFTGLNSAMLPYNVNDSVTYTSNGYDAGTELNDERSQTIVDGCGKEGTVPLPMDGDSRVATSEMIHHHPGIMGNADLSKSAHGWNDPVAKITIERVK